ncbi:hypothetical protein V493_02248 [Pseudogymnoascus sp. VKM F-4281 (FW-2241)]|nr:hypothetical protein V493_02248 [Pseudogymnoascus sp. VKM F-4281 (FW-2241)]
MTTFSTFQSRDVDMAAPRWLHGAPPTGGFKLLVPQSSLVVRGSQCHVQLLAVVSDAEQEYIMYESHMYSVPDELSEFLFCWGNQSQQRGLVYSFGGYQNWNRRPNRGPSARNAALPLFTAVQSIDIELHRAYRKEAIPTMHDRVLTLLWPGPKPGFEPTPRDFAAWRVKCTAIRWNPSSKWMEEASDDLFEALAIPDGQGNAERCMVLRSVRTPCLPSTSVEGPLSRPGYGRGVDI